MTKLYKVLRCIAKVIFKALFRFKGYDFENIPDDGNAVICANHTSAVDPIMMAVCCKTRQLCFMGKRELFQNKLLCKLFTALGGFPVDRQGNAMSAVRNAQKVLKNNGVVAIFPEGTRSKNGKIGQGKAGAALVALSTRSSIVPVSIYRKGKLRIFSKTVIRCGEPLSYEQLKTIKNEKGDLQAVIDEVMAKITSLWEMEY